MQKIYMYSHDINHLQFWENALEGTGEVIEDEELLAACKGGLILLDYDEQKEMNGLIGALSKENALLVLDATPNLAKAKRVLANGARGYGNVLMSKVYMYAAFETIESGNVWLMPALTQMLIQATPLSASGEKQEALLEPLTVAQKEVALLLREGLSNQEIAQRKNLSINTIKSQIKSIYTKLGVKDRIAFVMLFR